MGVMNVMKSWISWNLCWRLCKSSQLRKIHLFQAKEKIQKGFSKKGSGNFPPSSKGTCPWRVSYILYIFYIFYYIYYYIYIIYFILYIYIYYILLYIIYFIYFIYNIYNIDIFIYLGDWYCSIARIALFPFSLSCLTPLSGALWLQLQVFVNAIRLWKILEV